MSQLEIAVQLFLQLTVILAACRVVGWLGRRFLGQTQVVMEMVAGVLLGPSLLGLVAPGLQERIFPRYLVVAVPGGEAVVTHPSMSILFALSQLGLVLYMFLVGMELEPRHLRGRLRGAGAISAAGIVVPFTLGVLLTPWLLGRGGLFGPVALWTAAIYLGASLSVTAFPMLARILHERGLAGTRLGTLTLAAGSIDDALAWCLLAVVLATVRAAPGLALLAVGGGIVYCAFVLTAGRRVFRRFESRVEPSGAVGVETFTVVLLVLMLCALVTDAIGIYAVFGAFVCGAAMPRGPFAAAVGARVEPLTVTLLLPIFFVFSGLSTRIALLDSAASWALAGLIVTVAIAGKGLGCAVAARWAGEGWRDAARIGTLMNARGLMELIILNVGLEHGLITPTLFTIMVLMAIVTTLMASPLYTALSRGERLTAAPAGPSAPP